MGSKQLLKLGNNVLTFVWGQDLFGNKGGFDNIASS